VSSNEFPDYVKEAIENGEVIIDDEMKVARVLGNIDYDPNGDPDKQAGPMLSKLRRLLGIKQRLEYLGYKVEVVLA
jgi:hypothetical protein